MKQKNKMNKFIIDTMDKTNNIVSKFKGGKISRHTINKVDNLNDLFKFEKRPYILGYCEQQKIYHSWEDITSSIVYPTNPPQYPNEKRRCLNCGKVEELKTTQQEIKKWEVEK